MASEFRFNIFTNKFELAEGITEVGGLPNATGVPSSLKNEGNISGMFDANGTLLRSQSSEVSKSETIPKGHYDSTALFDLGATYIFSRIRMTMSRDHSVRVSVSNDGVKFNYVTQTLANGSRDYTVVIPQGSYRYVRLHTIGSSYLSNSVTVRALLDVEESRLDLDRMYGWSAFTSDMVTWNLDLGEGNEIYINKIMFVRQLTGGVSSMTLSGSNDGVNYTNLMAIGLYPSTYSTIYTSLTPMLVRYLRLTSTGATGGYNGNQNVFFAFFQSFSDVNFYVNYDLGENNSISPTGYTFNSSVTGKILKSWKLQGSNDNSDWFDIDTVTDYAGSFPYSKELESESYRYWRMLIIKSDSTYSNMVDINDFYISSPGGTYFLDFTPINIKPIISF